MVSLELETGGTERTVDYVSGTGTALLTFTWLQNEAGDTSSAFDFTLIPLSLNGGTVGEGDNAATTLTLDHQTSSGSLADNKAIVIDTTKSTVNSGMRTGR